MRVVILTSIAHGTASRCLPALLQSEKITVAGVILVDAPARQRFKIKPKKIRQIGLLGALNGLRLRRWYGDGEVEELGAICARSGTACIRTPSTNGPETQDALRGFQADLGLSLGNSYIHERIYSLPRFGMINVHGELLPEFKGAQSIIWPIYEGKTVTGLTIHEVSKSIDDGKILYRLETPIQFKPTLRATVESSLAATRAATPGAIRYVCENFEPLQRQAASQGEGKRYTTPSFRQFLRMCSNNRRFFRARAA